MKNMNIPREIYPLSSFFQLYNGVDLLIEDFMFNGTLNCHFINF